MTESKEREAYRKACRHYGIEGNCHVQSRTFFTRSEISDTELKIHMIANCTPHSICARMRRYDKWKNNQRVKEMKLKDLLKGRDKLRKYDDLKESVKCLREVQCDNGAPYECTSRPYQLHLQARNGNRTLTTFTMQPFMLQLFIDAIDAEIKKMEEE